MMFYESLPIPVPSVCGEEIQQACTGLDAAYQAGELIGVAVLYITPHEDGAEEHYTLHGMSWGSLGTLETLKGGLQERIATEAADAAITKARK